MREFPASPMQTAVYAASLDPLPGTAANTQISINFGEVVEIPVLRKAWKWITQYHGLLRSSFKQPERGALILREHEDHAITWRLLDWTKFPNEEMGARWKQLLLEDTAEPIDITKPPLYRFHVIELPGDMHHLLWTFHSILLDEESVFLILRDWLRVYNLLCRNQQLPTPQGSLSYAAVIGAIDNTEPEIARQYWKNTFQQFSSWCPLRPFYSQRATSSHVAIWGNIEFLLDRETTTGLSRLAISADASLLTVLIAAWSLSLARTSVDTDTIFGVYRSCRHLAGPQGAETIGLFESLLPLRVKIPEDMTCKAWLRQLQKEELALTPFLLTSTEEIWSNLPGNFSRFDSTLHYLPIGINDRIPAEMPEWMRFDARVQKAAPSPIRVIARGIERLSITLEYNSSLVSPIAARQLFDRLLQVMQSFEENLPLSQISIALPHETEDLLKLGSSPLEKSSSSRLFITLNELARRYTNLPAVEKEEHSLSFLLIDTYSRQLATFLKNHCQNSKAVIALAITPSPYMLVGLLGILRADCTCLPLNPSALPADIGQTFAHHKVSIILTDSNGSETLGKLRQACFVLDQIWNEITTSSTTTILSATISQPTDPAVLLLQPNGERILISHEMLQIALENAVRTYKIKPGDRVLCHSLQGSAASVEECLSTILAGATLVIPSKNVKSTRTAFQEAVESGRITHLRITSTFWSQWVHYLSELGQPTPASLRCVVIEAGHISRPVIEAWKELNKGEADCVTFYSPFGLLGVGIATERVKMLELSDNGLVCGRPQPGTIAFISDRHNRLLPPLFPGLLLLGSTYALGMKDAAIVTVQSDPWKVSATGEHARWNEHGELILISQPYHVLPEGLTWTELQQIEDVLTSHPDLIDAIVRGDLPKEDSQRTLCAWIVPRDSHGQFPTALESYLKDRLPKDWIPSRFALVTRFNLNTFDQVDTDALPQPEQIRLSKPKLIAPTTATATSSTSHTTPSPIITLRLGIVDTALYFVHAGRGLVEDYRPVVQALSGGYAVHCLMVPRGRSALSTTVEEITRQLASALRLHISGKFAVVGIGTGAVFAWELARQLDQMGEKDVPFVFFEIPPRGRKETSGWLHRIKKALFGNEVSPYSPQGRLSELLAAYNPPILHRKPYFFISGKPDPEWRRRAPLGIWWQLHLARGGSLLEEPREIAGALRDVLSPLHRERNSPSKKIH